VLSPRDNGQGRAELRTRPHTFDAETYAVITRDNGLIPAIAI